MTGGSKTRIPDLLRRPLLSNFLNLGFIQVSNAVVQILLFPIIIHVVGLDQFGMVMVANSFAALGGLVTNYGTSLSGIKDVTLHKSDSGMLAGVFYNILFTRFALAVLCMLSIPVLTAVGYHTEYLLLALPILLAEIVNPLFFFTGTEKLFIYNVANLASKLLASILILTLITNPEKAPWVNFYLGICSFIFYMLLSIYISRKYRLGKPLWNPGEIGRLLKNNFYLVGNNISVQLQQSFFLFSIATLHNPLLLGAYSLCDKIVWSFRLLLTAFSGALFPKAVRLYQEEPALWVRYRRTTNKYLAVCFITAGIALFFTAPLITRVLTGKDDPLTCSFIRCISFVPFVASMNLLNVLDLLIKNRYADIFKIAVIILMLTVTTALLFLKFGSVYSFGYYPLIIELCSIPLYLYFIRNSLKFSPKHD
ncbi:lipopolysaccharide biosynthesis protein [Sediminibacterium ginsengisoli]|uniref:Membrane protein involved in the export of O-antigen and teichoic acid n=1 Tax=Sediminibacterium ginsengisoli TaxID=413434 RepID=A0A1T4N2R5_9BACT|nr:oligosaccharide flippase family protein [Sediminibacterium ginsengisoli]SJZ73660.1 Membrane protein involved in the export of O-antigen and teichoic acid [Sediminibacterium ginsengisoli]